MRHPLLNINAIRRRWLMAFFLSLTFIATVILQMVNAPLQTTAAPQGIVSYELARTSPEAQRILDSWDGPAKLHAGFSLGFDYLYMLVYAFAIAIACVWGSEVWRGGLRTVGIIGVVLAWLIPVAALCDAIENLALWRMLLTGANSFAAQTAFWFAMVKFLLIGLSLCYVLITAARWIMDRRRGRG